MEIISISVQQGQSLMDIAIQYLGDAAGAIILAKLNNLSVTAELVPGQELDVDIKEVVNAKVAAYIKEKNIVPVTF